MRAAILHPDRVIRTGELTDPEPGPGEVLVRVAFAGVQWGDVLVRGGHFPVPLPFVPGFEAAGEIVAVGEGVDATRIGEQVAALTTSGAFAKLVAAPAALAIPTGSLDPQTAAGFGWVTPTAYDLVNTVGRVRAGDRVLIHAAAGGVGTLAVQFAVAAGATNVVGVVGGADQVGYALGSGYDKILVRDAFVAEATGNFDVILDPIGGATRARNAELLAPHGRLVVYGNIASWDPYRPDTNELLMTGRSLLTYNSNLLAQTHPARLAESARAAMAAVVTGDVRIDITAELALTDVTEALDRLEAGGVLGKSIIRVGS